MDRPQSQRFCDPLGDRSRVPHELANYCRRCVPAPSEGRTAPESWSSVTAMSIAHLANVWLVESLVTHPNLPLSHPPPCRACSRQGQATKPPLATSSVCFTLGQTAASWHQELLQPNISWTADWPAIAPSQAKSQALVPSLKAIKTRGAREPLWTRVRSCPSP